jgi:hypothetical protein
MDEKGGQLWKDEKIRNKFGTPTLRILNKLKPKSWY